MKFVLGYTLKIFISTRLLLIALLLLAARLSRSLFYRLPEVTTTQGRDPNHLP